MIYKFHSKASGDVIMLGANGDELLRIIGREPAPKGIIEPAAMAAAISALEAAAAADQARARENTPEAAPEGARREVSLHQRVWPMLEMLKRALPAEQPVVWGV